MAIKLSKSSGASNFAPAPAGSQAGVLISVVDLGTHWNPGGKFKAGWQAKVRLTFELADARMEDGRPFVVGREFTQSLGENSNLYAFLSGWIGAGNITDEFDLAGLLGRPAMVNVSHRAGEGQYKGKVFADLESASPFPLTFRGKPVDPPTPENDLVAYDTADGLPPEAVPEWMRKKILQSREFLGEAEAMKVAMGGKPTSPITPASGPTPNADGAEDDVPFDPAKY